MLSLNVLYQPSHPHSLGNQDQSQMGNPEELSKQLEAAIKPENVICQAPVRIFEHSVPDQSLQIKLCLDCRMLFKT